MLTDLIRGVQFLKLHAKILAEVAARYAKRLDWGDLIPSAEQPAAREDVPRRRQINVYDEKSSAACPLDILQRRCG
jgi:hypothetical protein